MADHRSEVPQTVQAIPSLGAVYIWLAEKPIEWWAGLLGILFLLLQIAHLLWRWSRDRRIEAERQRGAQFPRLDDE